MIRSRRFRRRRACCSPRPRTEYVCVACDHVLPLAGADLSRAGVDLVIAQTELAVAAVTPAPQRVPVPDCTGVGQARGDSLPGVSADLRGAGAVVVSPDRAGRSCCRPSTTACRRTGSRRCEDCRPRPPSRCPHRLARGWCGPSYGPDRAGRSCCRPSTTACRRNGSRRCEYRRPRPPSRYPHRLARGWCGPSYRPDRAGRSRCCPSTTACRRTGSRRCEDCRPRRPSRYPHRLARGWCGPSCRPDRAPRSRRNPSTTACRRTDRARVNLPVATAFQVSAPTCAGLVRSIVCPDRAGRRRSRPSTTGCRRYGSRNCGHRPPPS